MASIASGVPVGLFEACPAATPLKAGTYHLTATYAGNANFDQSPSSPKKLTMIS